jgi:hypothetical protein
MNRIVIAGSRSGVSEQLVKDTVTDILLKHPDVIVVTGGARGVDTIAHIHADALGATTEVYSANWGKYGNSAGFKRNELMVNLPDVILVVCIYSGRRTAGTNHTASLARRKGIELIEVGL